MEWLVQAAAVVVVPNACEVYHSLYEKLEGVRENSAGSVQMVFMQAMAWVTHSSSQAISR